MRIGFLALFLVVGCGDDSGSGDPADAPGGDGSGSVDSAPGGDGARPDAGTPPSCGGLSREVCEATAGCAPACISMCDCTCPGPPGDHEGCGCELCPATCFTYDQCVSTYGFTACGTEWCDPAEEVCVTHSGGIAITTGCERVPTPCQDDRTCDCLGPSLCGGGAEITCTADPEANTLTCDCLTCA